MKAPTLKIPTRTAVYAVIAVALAVVFVIQEFTTTERNTITVPELPDNVSSITIMKGADELTFTRQTAGTDGSGTPGPWVVGDAGYPADQIRVNGILDAVGSLTLVDVLTSSGERNAYGLDEDSRTVVTYRVDDGDVLSVDVGNRASAGSAVYGRINDGRETVLIPGTTLGDLTTAADDYRSRDVVTIPPSDIVGVSASGPGLPPVIATRAADAGTASAASEPSWTIESEADVSSAAVDDVVNSLGPLQADGFLADEPTGSPFAVLTVTRTSGEETVSLYPKNADGNYPVRAASYAYPFYVSEWRAKRLLFGLGEYFAAFNEE